MPCVLCNKYFIKLTTTSANGNTSTNENTMTSNTINIPTKMINDSLLLCTM